MKALSCTQPWATLIGVGSKRLETRSWAPPQSVLGKRIAIQAAKGFPKECRRLVYQDPFTDALILAPEDLPLGAVIATAVVRTFWRTDGGIHRVDEICRLANSLWAEMAKPYECDPKLEGAFGDYSSGRFAWLLDDVEQFKEPIPAKGMLGLWEWNQP